MQLEVRIGGFGDGQVIESSQLTHADLGAANTRERPDLVAPTPLAVDACDEGRLRVTLAPASWNVIRVAPRR